MTTCSEADALLTIYISGRRLGEKGSFGPSGKPAEVESIAESTGREHDGRGEKSVYLVLGD